MVIGYMLKVGVHSCKTPTRTGARVAGGDVGDEGALGGGADLLSLEGVLHHHHVGPARQVQAQFVI